VLMLIMVIVGGSVSMWGPVFGAAFAVGIVQLQQSLGSYQNLAYGLTLMAAIGILPGGIVSLWGKSLTLLRKLLAVRAERTSGTADTAGAADTAGTAGPALTGERADAAVAAATPPAG
jgi:branched-chain amino acid transport system permease protein